MAALFGTGIAADAFSVAFRFPNLFKILVGEGAFSAAFLPKFAEVKHREGNNAGFAMASGVLLATILLVIVISILGIIFAPQIIGFIVIGWQGDIARKTLAVKLVRVMFIMVTFTGLASYCQAILNAHHKFFVSAIAPALLNFAWLAGIGIAAWGYVTEQKQITIVAVAVVIGALLQFIWQFPWILKLGWRFTSQFRYRLKDLLEVGKLYIPILIALASNEFYYFADVILGSFLKGGSVSSLAYANRLLYLPLGLIGFAIATASLPGMADSAARKDNENLASLLSYSTRATFTFLIPIAFAAITLRYEIVALLFERGSFSASSSTPMVAYALLFYMIGLPFFGVQRALTQGYYALKDTFTPVIVASVGMIINIETSMIFMLKLEHGGLALGSSITGFCNTFMLLYYIKRILPELNLKPIIINILKVLSASAITSCITYYSTLYINPLLDFNILILTRLLQLVIPSAIFLIVFTAFSKIFKIDEVKHAYDNILYKFRN